MTVRTKRAYEPPSPSDGIRILVDRLWPRGISRQKLKLDAWMKEIAPSNDLRKRYHHDDAQWDEFQKHYFEELKGQPELVGELRKLARRGTVTLVYAAKDEAHNNAVALKTYLTRRRS